MINIGVIGFGYWGPNLARNLSQAAGGKLTAISDLNPKARAKAERLHPSTAVLDDPLRLIAMKEVDAVAIATPVSTHFDLALAALQAGKHVLVTKPMTATTEQAQRLINEAQKKGLTLMVDHTFVYSGPVRKIKELAAKDLGDLYYYDSVRVNLGLFQHDVDVLWDLAVHDLSIMDFVLASQPRAISATGVSHVKGGMINTAYLTAFFDNNLIGHIHANWLSPVKLRRTLIGGSRKMIVYDDTEVSEKVKVYDRGITVAESPEQVYHQLIGYRSGDMWAPHLDITEALQVEADHFTDCIQKKARPITDGEAGLRTVRLLEAATRSIKEHGRPVELAAAGV
ncbi:MAG: Gfo/Idh/MocA family oxidoreductase [Elusimicrobiota bacterium]|jgi:predicted dehydrogenase